MPDLSQLNALDWVIIVVLGVSTLVSLWRGFVKEALSLLAWVAAFVVAHLFVDRLAMQLGGVVDNATGRYILAYALLFVATLVVFTLVIKLATGLVRLAGLTVLDRLLGTVFGFARGVILILALAWVAEQLVPARDRQWLQQSVLVPQITMLVDWVQAVFANAGPGNPKVT